MPEGDTLFRTAAGLRPHLVGRPVTAASARPPGPPVERLIGSTVESVESRGKHLLIRFDSGDELRTHLGMRGSWHRYAPGERWQRAAARARLVLEVPGAVAVCFDAPTVELFRVRDEAVHPVLKELGPDLLDPEWNEASLAEAVRRLRAPSRGSSTIAEALLDQRAVAGIGNIYKNEALFAERVHPFVRIDEVDDATLARLVETARTMLVANKDGGRRATRVGGGRGADAVGAAGSGVAGPGAGRGLRTGHAVYGRAGLPCRRCGTIVVDRRHGALGRRTFWCPACQPAPSNSSGGER